MAIQGEAWQLRLAQLPGGHARPGARRCPSYKPKVAVLIPAYNEEKVIERTVRAALNSNYPNLRVIVIDDG